MKRMLTACLLAGLAAGTAQADSGPLYTGQPGELPVQVALAYLAPDMGRDGQFEYARLRISQRSQPESFDRVSVSIQQDGLLDDSVRARRWSLQLIRGADSRWYITRQLAEQRCYRGPQGWQRKSCP